MKNGATCEKEIMECVPNDKHDSGGDKCLDGVTGGKGKCFEIEVSTMECQFREMIVTKQREDRQTSSGLMIHSKVALNRVLFMPVLETVVPLMRPSSHSLKPTTASMTFHLLLKKFFFDLIHAISTLLILYLALFLCYLFFIFYVFFQGAQGCLCSASPFFFVLTATL